MISETSASSTRPVRISRPVRFRTGVTQIMAPASIFLAVATAATEIVESLASSETSIAQSPKARKNSRSIPEVINILGMYLLFNRGRVESAQNASPLYHNPTRRSAEKRAGDIAAQIVKSLHLHTHGVPQHREAPERRARGCVHSNVPHIHFPSVQAKESRRAAGRCILKEIALH